MSLIDTEAIAKKMTAAAKAVVKDKWPSTRKYFESESKIFAERLAGIAKMRNDGLISEARAKQHLEFQTTAWETVLLAVNGLNQLMVEEALNAAIDVIREVVNKAARFALL